MSYLTRYNAVRDTLLDLLRTVVPETVYGGRQQIGKFNTNVFAIMLPPYDLPLSYSGFIEHHIYADVYICVRDYDQLVGTEQAFALATSIFDAIRANPTLNSTCDICTVTEIRTTTFQDKGTAVVLHTAFLKVKIRFNT